MPAQLQTLIDRVTSWHERLLRPGSGRLVRLSMPAANADGDIVLVGQSVDALDRAPVSRLYRLDRASRRLVPLTGGSTGMDLDPVFAPDGRAIAFRSGYGRTDGFGAALFDFGQGEIDRAPTFDGSVEMIGWLGEDSLLLQVAEPGAALASTQGAIANVTRGADEPGWYPSIDEGAAGPARRLHIWAPRERKVEPVGGATNVWESVPVGLSHAAVVGSDDTAEDAWYEAELRLVDLVTGEARLLHRPERQIGALSTSGDGQHIAFVEGLASDRGSLAGVFMLVDTASGATRGFETGGADISWTGWDGSRFIIAGIRGDDSVILAVDPKQNAAAEIISIPATAAGIRYPVLAPMPERSEIVTIIQSIRHLDRVVLVSGNKLETLATIETQESAAAILEYGSDRFVQTRWTASDGVQIDGFLHTPPGGGPFPLVMTIHGGPTSRWTPRAIVDQGLAAALASCGIAQFYPNPRGSTGRGQAYAEAILHDMGGRDARDLLEGLDALVARGIADGERLGVTGASHGGFMTSWLVTQDNRFSAAVAIAPITDWESQRLTSNIPSFNERFVGSPEAHPPSPVLYAERVNTPVMLIAGARDNCTPPAQAEHFHRALRLMGKPSTLIVYPLEGHGIRSLPAAIDHIARITAFFDMHLNRPERDLPA